ncbi:hypothetical protein [Arthrobacter sp. fls2-241-R2A-172]|nr:hypothetical protein [Arthrobacter sp. fls2-241-R2A-172]
MTTNTAQEPKPDPVPVLTAKLAQLLQEHPDFYAQIFPTKKDQP